MHQLRKILLFSTLLFSFFLGIGQGTNKCAEIRSILVNACGNPEGQNEMITIEIGGSNLNISNLTVNLPNSTQTVRTPNITTASYVQQMNDSIRTCGLLLEPTSGVLPARSTVLYVTGYSGFSPSANLFTYLRDTLYVIFGTYNNTGGNFRNWCSPSSPSSCASNYTRTTRITFSGTPSCSDTAIYYPSRLTNIYGQDTGGFWYEQDGARVDFEHNGQGTYVNYGCQGPYTPLSVNISSDSQSYCLNTDTIKLITSTQGEYNNLNWSHNGNGNFIFTNDSEAYYLINNNDTGLIKFKSNIYSFCGDSLSDSLEVEVLDKPSIVFGPNDTICYNSSLILSVSGADTYLWNNPSNSTYDTAIIYDSGWYSVRASNRCNFIRDSIFVDIQFAPSVSLNPNGTQALCPGKSSITFRATTTNQGLIQWSDNSQADSLVVTSVNDYFVRTYNGCGSDTNFFQVISQSSPVGSIQILDNDTLCPNESARLVVSGGDSYLWPDFSVSDTFAVDSAGYYEVEVINYCGIDTVGVNIYAKSLPDAYINLSGNQNICPGDSLKLISNRPADTYLWSTSETDSVIFAKDTGFNYFIILENRCGRDTSDTANIIFYNLPTANIISSGTQFCNSDSLLLRATGGTSYSWNNATTTDRIYANDTGWFWVDVSNLCATDRDSIRLSYFQNPNANVNVTDTSFCFGDSIRIGADTGQSYIWSNGAFTDSITIYDSTIVQLVTQTQCGRDTSPFIYVYALNVPSTSLNLGDTILCQGDSLFYYSNFPDVQSRWSNNSFDDTLIVRDSGNYFLLVENLCGTAFSSFRVDQRTLPTSSLLAFGDSTLCTDSAIQVQALGGDSIRWNFGSNNRLESIDVSGTFYFVSYNICGTDTSRELIIDSENRPTASISIIGSQTFCPDDTVTLKATGSDSIRWINGSLNDSINVSDAGTYWTIAANQCGSDTSFVTLDTIALTSAEIVVNGFDTLCPSDSVNLISLNSASSYSWNNGVWLDSSIWVFDSGTYYLVTSNHCGSDTSNSVYIGLNPSPNISISPIGSFTFCPSDSVLITANGIGSLTWSEGGNGTTYYAKDSGLNYVIDQTACGSDTAFYRIHYLPLPNVQISIDKDTICDNEMATISASGGINYLWSNGNTGNQIQIQDTEPYYVIASNSCGSDTSISVSVTQLFSPSISILEGNRIDTCTGNPVSINANSSTNFIWDNGSTTNPRILNTQGQYKAFTSNYCGSDSAEFILVYRKPKADFRATPEIGEQPLVVQFSNQSRQFSAQIWDFGDGNQSTELNPENTYYDTGIYFPNLIVIDSFGCSDTALGTIQVVERSFIWVPDAFSPNGDGHNQFFKIESGGLDYFEIRIFNRWGEIIFESDNPAFLWEGTYKGTALPLGIYPYTLKYITKARVKENLKGVIHIVR